MLEIILMGIAIIALAINLIGLVRLFIAHKRFSSGLYKVTLKSIVFIVVFLNLFIIVDVVNDYVLHFIENIELSLQLNLVLFVLALLTTLSLMIGSIITIRMAKEHGFK